LIKEITRSNSFINVKNPTQDEMTSFIGKIHRGDFSEA